MDQLKAEAIVTQRLRTLSIICAALVGSVVIYAVVAWVVLEQGDLEISEALAQSPVLPLALAAAGFAALGSAPLVSKLVLRGSGATTEEDPELLINRYQTSVIVGFAVRESAAVFGLVATFLTGSMLWVGVLGAAAVCAMLAAWPRKQAALAALRRSQPGSPILP